MASDWKRITRIYWYCSILQLKWNWGKRSNGSKNIHHSYWWCLPLLIFASLIYYTKRSRKVG